MNAPVRVSELLALGDIHDFEECVGHHVWFFTEGWIDLQTAVDNLWRLGERWLLVEELGADRVQQMIAQPFAIARGSA
ncbi:hypothetical protein [Bradyrhizobium zhanjiangense]|uniref:Uncharacterized protein n=1 Tax=Bradyrhizobium zhanjiangense TaxID=1325107 RepID=A0ABY0D9A4_9BRAD|nr:hypothetical protein [Bradyrhizobium zhanjiangense]RXG86501.1 hypothetical protein EAS62_37295 [Bradyrhizobium zhanjiangense]